MIALRNHELWWYIWVIDQAWGQDGWIFANSFFFFLRVDGPRRSRGPWTRKKRTRPISSNLDRTSLVNKEFIIWDKTPKHDKFSLRDKARIPSRQDSYILPARVATHSARFRRFILPAHGDTILDNKWNMWTTPPHHFNGAVCSFAPSLLLLGGEGVNCSFLFCPRL